MSLINNKIHDNISYTDIFCSFGPLPNSLNLLDKIELIQYNGIRIPRIPLGKDYSLNLEGLLYDTVNYIDLYKSNKSNNNKYHHEDKYIYKNNTKNNENSLILEDSDKKDKISNDKNNPFDKGYLCSRNSVYQNIYQKKMCLNDIVVQDEKNSINLKPPEKFIYLLKNEKNDKNCNYINNIILNNINYINVIYNNNLFSSFIIQKPINQIIRLENCSNKNDNYNKSFLQFYNNIFTDSFSYLFSSSFNINSNKKSKSKYIFKVNTSPYRDEILQDNNFLIKKRGRKQTKLKKSNQRIHSAKDDDNILRKIQVHYLSFVTNFTNDIIRVFIINNDVPLFKNIDYKLKKTVRHKYIEELKNKSIGEILQLKASPKLKVHDDSVNKNIYNKVCSLCPFMKIFLQRNYVSLFKEYYYNKNKIFIINGRFIPLSIKTKTFHDLINKNYAYKEKLKYIAINYFLTKFKKFKKPNFMVNTISDDSEDEK